MYCVGKSVLRGDRMWVKYARYFRKAEKNCTKYWLQREEEASMYCVEKRVLCGARMLVKYVRYFRKSE